MNWKKVDWTDHEFAVFLRKHSAIEHWSHRENITSWFRPSTGQDLGTPVAWIKYHGHTFHTKFINEDLTNEHTVDDRSQG